MNRVPHRFCIVIYLSDFSVTAREGLERARGWETFDGLRKIPQHLEIRRKLDDKLPGKQGSLWANPAICLHFYSRPAGFLHFQVVIYAPT